MSAAQFGGFFFAGAAVSAAGLYFAGAFDGDSKFLFDAASFALPLVLLTLAVWYIASPSTFKIESSGGDILSALVGICTPAVVLYANSGADDDSQESD
jgi:hypothetical protein